MDLDHEQFDDSGEVEIESVGAGADDDDDDDGGDTASIEADEYRKGEFAGKITKISGDVWVCRPDGSRQRAKAGTLLLKDDYLQTGPSSKCQFRDDRGNKIRIHSRTVFHTGTKRHNKATAVFADMG